MHEMALAQGILDIAIEHAASHEINRITCIKLKIGQMSQVEPEALRFGFSVLSEATLAQGAKLDINIIPLKAKCMACGSNFFIENFCFSCSECNSNNIVVVSGRELTVEYLEVE